MLNNIYSLDLNTNDIILYTVIALLLIILIFFVLFLLKINKKEDKINIDSNFIQMLVELFGGKNNIISTEVVNQRLMLEVKDTKICKLEELNKISQKGVFVTNNKIKMLFSYESQDIKKELDKIIK